MNALAAASIQIQPITEDVLDHIVEAAGGKRAHADQYSRTKPGADYVLGRSVVELKILEDEGLEKTERQRKLAGLFTPLDPERPVHVLDRELLDDKGRRAYDRALEGPIKGAIRKAKAQLAQSRIEYPAATRSILFIVNNGNTALNHDDIVQLATRRARNDTDEIDGVVVAGAYLYSDGFDTVVLWPINYIPIHLDRDFPEYYALRDAFHAYAGRAMTAAIVEGTSVKMTKRPVLDTGFELDGVAFVKPAPPWGSSSDFYANGRPRLNSTEIDVSPRVGVVFPELSRAEWMRFRKHLPDEPKLGGAYEDWLREREYALIQGTLLKPLVPVAITLEEWLRSLRGEVPERPFQSICSFATNTFERLITDILASARDLNDALVFPSRFILAHTEIIGQDKANDVSHIFLVQQSPGSEPRSTALVTNVRIFHLHACALGAAYAVKHGVSALLWKKDFKYAWV